MKASRKAILVLAILGLAALLGSWFGQCGPNEFGLVSRPSDPSASDAATEAPRVTVTVVGDRCRVGSNEAQLCSSICAEMQAEVAGHRVVLDGAQGSHGVVVDVRRCLEDAGVEVVIKRD